MKRDYPIIESPTSRWILGFLLSILSFILVAFLSYFLKIDNMILNAVTLSTIGIVSLFIIDRDFVKKVFKPLKPKDIIYILVGVVIMFVSIVISSIVMTNIDMDVSTNPIFGLIDEGNILEFFISSVIQFITEEIIFIIPFLFVMNKFDFKSEKLKIIVAVIVSSVIFGLMHLSTYNFNFLQAILIISIIRIGLTMSYIISKNLTVTYLVHIIYDWGIILIGMKYAVGF